MNPPDDLHHGHHGHHRRPLAGKQPHLHAHHHLEHHGRYPYPPHHGLTTG